MPSHRHFCLHNQSGVTRPVIVILAVCVLVMSAIAGYFVSESNAVSTHEDPIIEDAVRPASVRAIQDL